MGDELGDELAGGNSTGVGAAGASTFGGASPLGGSCPIARGKPITNPNSKTVPNGFIFPSLSDDGKLFSFPLCVLCVSAVNDLARLKSVAPR